MLIVTSVISFLLDKSESLSEQRKPLLNILSQGTPQSLVYGFLPSTNFAKTRSELQNTRTPEVIGSVIYMTSI